MRHFPSFATLFIVLLVGAPAGAQGVLTFENPNHDLGTLAAGEKARTTFSFTNTGDQPVRLTDVRPSCGCTAPHYTTDAVAPGESGVIDVEFDSTNRSGPFRQSVFVLADTGADDPAGMTIMISGHVVPAGLVDATAQGGVSFDADVFDFGTVSAGSEVRHQFTMRRTGASPLQITRVHAFPAGAVVEYPERPVFRDDVVRIAVSLPPGAVNGDVDVTIALETDDADEPVKVLRLKGRAE